MFSDMTVHWAFLFGINFNREIVLAVVENVHEDD